MSHGDADGRDPETLRLYWTSQWERIHRLEDQRLQFSNLVVAASVIAIGVSVGSEPSPWIEAGVSGTVVASNVIAWIYGLWSDRWLLMHRRRSNILVEDNWSYIAELEERAGWPNARFPIQGHTIQAHRALHLVLVAIAIALIVAVAIDA